MYIQNIADTTLITYNKEDSTKLITYKDINIEKINFIIFLYSFGISILNMVLYKLYPLTIKNKIISIAAIIP